jgi:hypothetical protein
MEPLGAGSVKGFIAVTLSGVFAQTADIPGIDTIVEKSGVWGIVGLLLYYLLGRFDKKLDALTEAIEKLVAKVESNNEKE